MQPGADELGECALLVQDGIVLEQPHDLLRLAATLTADTYGQFQREISAQISKDV